jgi:hypothetical protein
MSNANEPAFPVEVEHADGEIHGIQTGNTTGWRKGITKREYFSAMAMQGLLSCRAMENITNNMGLPDLTIVAQEAVAYADHLLQQLEQ